jgi:predicted ATPase with chaperone activity
MNARLLADQTDRYFVLAPKIEHLLEEAMIKQKLSVRGFHKVLRVALNLKELKLSNAITL